MIVNRYDQVVLGSSALQTSVADEEIIPTGKTIINFELVNDQICTIKINGGAAIYVRANQGINIPIVKSCKIVEDNKTFSWIGISG
jgi:hypothetical protein